MSDTTTAKDRNETLRQMVGVALIDGYAARQSLLEIAMAFDAEDVDKARLIAGNYRRSQPAGYPADSIQNLLYEGLPRDGGGDVSYG